jgi:hypothetical protein
MVWSALLAKSALPSNQSSRKKKRGGRAGAVNRTKGPNRRKKKSEQIHNSKQINQK